MNNLIIAYDLNREGQDYSSLRSAIGQAGKALKIQRSLWFVLSPHSAEHVRDFLCQYIDRNDSLAVIDPSRNTVAFYNLMNEEALKKVWGAETV